MSSTALTFQAGSKDALSLPHQEPVFSTDQLQGRLINILSHIQIDDLNTVYKIQSVIHEIFQDLKRPLPEKPIKISPKHKIVVFRSDQSVELYLYPTKEKTTSNKDQKGRSKEFREAYKIEVSIENPGHIIDDVPEKVALLKSTLSGPSSYSDKEAFFKHEIELLKTLKDSPQCSNLYASTIYDGSKQGLPVRKGIMVQKYYPNGDFEDLLNERVKQPSKACYKTKWLYIKELLIALLELENQRICHSDLTPANIMLGSQKNAVIIDFEFALSLNELEANNRNELIRKYLSRGTPELMPPEKIRAAMNGTYFSSADLKGNVWSVGCIIHYLLEGEWPLVVTKVGKYVLEKQQKTHLLNSCDPGDKGHAVQIKSKILENQKKEIFQIFEDMQIKADSFQRKTGMEYLLKMMLHPDPLKRFSAKEAYFCFNEIHQYV